MDYFSLRVQHTENYGLCDMMETVVFLVQHCVLKDFMQMDDK